MHVNEKSLNVYTMYFVNFVNMVCVKLKYVPVIKYGSLIMVM